MTDASQYTQQEIADNAAYWSRLAAEQGQQTAPEPEEVAPDPFAAAAPPSEPTARDLTTQIFDRAIADGEREETAMGIVIAASAQAAMRGDQRFIHQTRPITVGGQQVG